MRALTPVDVLNVHADLAARMQHPDPATADYIAFNMQKTLRDQRKTDTGVTSAFHPVVPHGFQGKVTDQHGTDMARLLGRSLGRSVTYQVTAKMAEELRAVYDSTQIEVNQLDGEDLPSPAGFAWLDVPWEISTPAGSLLVRALSWEFTELWTLEEMADRIDPALASDPAALSVLWPAVRICLWKRDGDYDQDNLTGSRRLDLTHTSLVPFGIRFLPVDESTELESANSFFGLVHLLWIYLGMELASAEKRGIPAAVRKWTRRSIRHAEVRVVLLRKTRSFSEPSGEHRPVNWSCRWTVDEHHRHRERPADGHRGIPGDFDKHCVKCGGELFLVRSYVKGPAGLPLHVPDKTLMKLAR